MYVPRTREERVLLRACELIAQQANPDPLMTNLIVSVARAQADDEVPLPVKIDGRCVTYIQHVVAEAGLPDRSDL